MNIIAIKPDEPQGKPRIYMHAGIWWAQGKGSSDEDWDAAMLFVSRLNMPLLKPDLLREQAL